MSSYLMFWPFIGIVWLFRSLVLFLWRKYVTRIEEETIAPLVLYKEKFAAAVEAIDHVRDDLDASEALEELLLTVAETISVNLGLRKKDYRMLFFTPISAGREIEIAGFRLGKQFELVDEGRLNDAFYSKDLRVIQGCLEQENTELVIPNISLSDAKTILFARNPGKLRLGLYIAILKENFDIEMAKEVFPQVSQEGGDEDVET